MGFCGETEAVEDGDERDGVTLVALATLPLSAVPLLLVLSQNPTETAIYKDYPH